jgi:hypothetical protein
VALVRTGILKEHTASIIMVTRIGELGIILAVSSNRSTLSLVTLMMEAIRSFETSVLTRATQHHIPEGGIFHRKHSVSETRFVYVFILQERQ